VASTISFIAEFHAVHLGGVALVGEKVGWRLPSPKVSEGGDVELVLLRDGVDGADHAASSLRGTVASSRIVVGRRRARAEKALRRAVASCGGLGGVGGAPDGVAPCVRQSARSGGLVGHGGGVAVGLDQQNRFGVARQSDFREVFDAAERRWSRNSSVQGMILAAMMAETVPAAASIAAYVASKRLAGGGFRQELQEQHLGDDAERALAADEEVAEVVAGDVLHALGAEPADGAVGEDDLEAHDVVAGDAVFQAAQTAGVLGDVAADGADLHRAGIGRIEQPAASAAS
jgi:hypothetical protein